MLILDFDIVGIFIFLWFIFKGLRSSKEAKRRYEERQKGPRPVSRNNEGRTNRLPSLPKLEPKPQYESVPSRPEPSKSKEVKKWKDNPKVKDVTPSVKKEVAPSPSCIQLQETQWKAQKANFPINQKAVLNGVVWAEILGPPRAKKKRF